MVISYELNLMATCIGHMYGIKFKDGSNDIISRPIAVDNYYIMRIAPLHALGFGYTVLKIHVFSSIQNLHPDRGTNQHEVYCHY